MISNIVMKMVRLYGLLKVLGDFQDYCGVLSQNLYILIYRKKWRILPLLTLVEAPWYNFWLETVNQVFKGLRKTHQILFHSQSDVCPFMCNLASFIRWMHREWMMSCRCCCVQLAARVLALKIPWLLCWSGPSQQWWGSSLL